MKNGSICVQGNRSASPWVQLDTLCDELSCYIYFMAGCDNIFVEDKVLNIFGSFVRFSDSKAFVCLLVFGLLFWMNGTICWKGSLSIQEFNPTKYTMAFLPALLR